MSRRLTMSPGVPEWFWAQEEKLREVARTYVASLREARAKSAQGGSSAGESVENPEGPRLRKDPFQIAYETFKRSKHPEDLMEFKRRLKLFAELVREEARARGINL